MGPTDGPRTAVATGAASTRASQLAALSTAPGGQRASAVSSATRTVSISAAHVPTPTTVR